MACGCNKENNDDDGEREQETCCGRKRRAENNDDGELEACCGGQRCVCFPYDDGYMIAAQIISIVAFLVSWIWWVTFLIGLGCMATLQIMWCCRPNKIGVLASSGLAVLASAMCFVAGIIMLVLWKDKRYCEVFVFDGSGSYDDDYSGSYYSNYYLTPNPAYEHPDYCREGAWSIVAFVTGIMWFAVAGCIFYFVKSGRHAKWEAKFDCDNNNDNDATATAIEMGAVSATATPTIATATGEIVPPPAVDVAVAAADTVLPEISSKVDNV